jgi:YidC/Oxa1 family membrane protein insertase
MQSKNLITFFLLSFAVLVGWSYLHNQIWPPKPREKQPILTTENAPVYDYTRLTLAPLSAGQGLDTAYRVATEVALLNKSSFQPKPPPVKPSPEQPRPVVAAPKIEPVEIGGDGFRLKARLTPKGAGVEQVILNDFEQADWYGLAEKDADGKPKKLELIQDHANARTPSHVLYHYGVKEDPEHPEPELGELVWHLVSKKDGAHDQEHEVVFSAQVPKRDIVITKTYTLKPEDYHIGLAIKLERTAEAGAEPETFRYQLTGAHGVRMEGVWYTTTYRNSLIGLEDVKGGIERDLQLSQKIGFQAGGQKVDRQSDPNDPKKDLFIRYAGVATQYFASMIVVDNKQDKGTVPNFLAWARPTVEGEPDPQKQFLDDITVRVVSDKITLEPGKTVVHKYLLYNGPVKVRLLGHLEGTKEVPDDLVERYLHTLHLDSLTDYHSPGPLGSFANSIGFTRLVVACTNIMHGLLYYLHKFIMPWSYGISIILLTVVVRGLMFPLSRKQSMASARMQEKMQKLNKELAPEIKKLEEKFKDDPGQLRLAKHELYMKHGVNPAAMLSSCWLMFAQLPIFLGLYYALQESINFRLQPFLWINNLAAPDMLFSWGQNIPWISQPHYLGSVFYLGPFFNLLPIIWVALMLIQQKTMMPATAEMDDQVKMQMKMMKYMMLVFFFFFYKVPAGLCIYWIGSILWSLGERRLLPKKNQPTGGDAAPAVASRKESGPPPSPRSKQRKVKGAKGERNGAKQRLSDWWAEVLKQAKKK